jgi:D-inositol-3-phosphate glycosyltransferase
VKGEGLRIAMLSIHSNPIGKLGTQDTGGMSVYIRELARELGGRGHRIDIYTRKPRSGYQQILNLYENVRLIHLGIPNSGDLSKLSLYPYLPKFFRSLEKFRTAENLEYDLIHSHYWLSGRLGSWAQRLWNVPHVVMYHTLGALKNRTGVGVQEPAFRIAAEKELVKSCDRILAPTELEKVNLIRYYGAPAEKIGVVPCGVNLQLFHPQEKAAARNKLKLEPDDVILMYVGRFEPLKGITTLLEALTYLKHHPRLRLLIVGGDGNGTPESQSLILKTKDLGIDDRVMFAGQIEQQNLPPYYGAADVLVMSSHYESFGLVGLEALACGRPVVSTPVGAVESLILKGRAGRIVADISAQSLAKGIQSIITDSEIPAPEVIRKSVLEYSWSNVATAMIEEYETALKQHYFDEDYLVPAKASCG